MDMGIVNAGQLAVYDTIEPELREACEDVVLNRARRTRPSGCWRSPSASRARPGKEAEGQGPRLARMAGREAASAHALVNGITEFIDADTEEARLKADAAAARHRRAADGRHERRRRPVRRRQDVPAAGGEVGARDEAGGGPSAALSWRRRRTPTAMRTGRQSAGKILMATVKGDVHDIGKNIVGVVLSLQQLRDHRSRRHGAGGEDPRDGASDEKVDIIGLSGLITPSLDEMVHVAAEMEREGFDIPLLIGGATTSRVHTAVKIHPRYDGGPDGLRHRRQPRRRRRLRAAVARDSGRPMSRTSRPNTRRSRDAHRRSRRPTSSALPLAKARANALHARLGRTTRRPSRASSARACSRPTTWPSSPATSTGRRSSRPGS